MIKNKHNHQKTHRILIAIIILSLLLGVTLWYLIFKTITLSAENHRLSADLTALSDYRPLLEEYLAGERLAQQYQDPDTQNSIDPNDRTPADPSPPVNTQPFYKNGILVVNKKHPLPVDYAPGVDQTALTALNRLISDAQQADVKIVHAYSAYRSYSEQNGIFAGRSSVEGVTAAETLYMRPGYSEHQTGLAFDLQNAYGQLYRKDDPSYDPTTDWVYQHAPEYGFIVRYRADWQSVTGLQGEPWHLRYLGTATAKAVYQSDLPLETYLGVDGGDYRWND